MTIDLPRWFYEGDVDGTVLAIPPAYFEITSGTARWLYRVMRRHAGRQTGGCQNVLSWCRRATSGPMLYGRIFGSGPCPGKNAAAQMGLSHDGVERGGWEIGKWAD